MEFQRRDLSDEQLIHLYKNLLWPRLIEEKMLLLLRQGNWPGSNCRWRNNGFAG
jgi:TPP-dependent pyruvate/acetoin dehydrogenase alpha subunit